MAEFGGKVPRKDVVIKPVLGVCAELYNTCSERGGIPWFLKVTHARMTQMGAWTSHAS